MRHKIDQILNKLMSRKLLVLGIASVGLYLGVLDSESFSMIAISYIGSQAVVDAAAQIKFGKDEDLEP